MLMPDDSRAAQRTSLLVVFGMMLTTVGLTVGPDGPYGWLSWIFLALGVVLPAVALFFVDLENGAPAEGQTP